MCKGLYPPEHEPNYKSEPPWRGPTVCHLLPCIEMVVPHGTHPRDLSRPTGSTSVPARLERSLQTANSLVRWWIPESAKERRCLEDRTVDCWKLDVSTIWAWEIADRMSSSAVLDMFHKVYIMLSGPGEGGGQITFCHNRNKKMLSGDFLNARLWVCLKLDTIPCRICGAGINCRF